MISAIILAAGESKRMGQPKLILPWGKEVVLSHVITIFREAGLEDINIITGGAGEEIENTISNMDVRVIHNDYFAHGEMLSSIQCGLGALTSQTEAVLIGLGDQPQVKSGTVRRVCDAYIETRANIVVPSYQMRRGHPWLVARPLWNELLALEAPQSPRDFLGNHKEEILYVNVEDAAILADLDTPDDYQRWKP